MSQRPRWWTGRVLSPTVSGGSGTELVALTPLLAGPATPAPLPGRGRGEVCGVVVAFVTTIRPYLAVRSATLSRRARVCSVATSVVPCRLTRPPPSWPVLTPRRLIRRSLRLALRDRVLAEAVAEYGEGEQTDQKTVDAICMCCPREWRPCPGWRQSSARRCLARCGIRCGDPAAVALDPPGRNGGDLGRAQDFDVSRT